MSEERYKFAESVSVCPEAWTRLDVVEAFRTFREKIAALESSLREIQARMDAAIATALRYESRHDLDPERGKLWGEHKMALMVYSPTPAAKEDACPDCGGRMMVPHACHVSAPHVPLREKIRGPEVDPGIPPTIPHNMTHAPENPCVCGHVRYDHPILECEGCGGCLKYHPCPRKP